MTQRLARLQDAIRRPLPLGYHPLYRFYPGGSLTRTFLRVIRCLGPVVA
jgi:hypothetical protein